MKIKLILTCLAAAILASGCASQKNEQNIIGPDSIKADALVTYYNGATYFTKQQHFYDVEGLKLKVKANEPAGAYEATYSGSAISLSNDIASKFWNLERAKLLTYAFAASGKYVSAESLKFTKTDKVVRIQGILYNVYTKSDVTLFARVSDGQINRLQIDTDGKILSAFCYNSYYEARLGNVVSHNIDIYSGSATGIDTELVYGVKYTGF